MSSCAPRPWIGVARTGSLTDLRRYVEVAAERRQFNAARTSELAEVVAEREIATATDAAAYDRVVGLEACASELYWPLKHRSKGEDDISAAASLVLLESGQRDLDESDLSYAHSKSGAWRAVTARAAFRPERRSQVYEALADSDLRVRRAAIRTINAGPMLADGRVLVEVARLDPDMQLRQSALSTLGEIGDLNSLLLIRDTWDEMTEPSRMAYLQALNAPASRIRGGQILTRIMEADDSLEGVVAASLLCSESNPPSGYAVSRLVQALRQGTLSERLVALSSLPASEPELQIEISKFAQSDTPYLRVAALELWLRLPPHAEQAWRRLQAVAQSKDTDALEASRILAMKGDEDSILRLEQRLAAPFSGERIAVARLLLQLKRWGAVARALTDDHPAVRLATACNVLAQ